MQKKNRKRNQSDYYKAVQKRIDWLINRISESLPNSSAFMSYGWYNGWWLLGEITSYKYC